MKICITAEKPEIHGPIDPRFGRCNYFLIYDTETENYEAIPNTNRDGFGGVGVQSGQLMAEHKVEVVITGNVGPNAYRTLEAGGLEVVTGAEGTAEEALKSYQNGTLKPTSGPNVSKDAGKRM